MKLALRTSLFLYLLLAVASVAQAALRQISSPVIIAAPKVRAVAADEAERLYLADSEGGVRVVSAVGEELLKLPRVAAGRLLLQRPRGIAIAGDRIYIADEKLNQIVLFDTKGTYLGSFGKDGSNAKEFDEPTSLTICCGLLFVADSGNGRIQVFSQDGIYLSSFGQEGAGDSKLVEPTQIVAEPGGRLIILDDEKIKLFSPAGDFIRTIATIYSPIAIAADAEGILLADENDLKVIKVDFSGKELFSFGSKGKDRSQFLSISGLALSPGGRMLISDEQKAVVQILTADSYPTLTRFNLPPPQPSARIIDTIKDMPLEQLTVAPDGTVYGIFGGKEKSIVAIKGKTTSEFFTQPKWNPVAIAAVGDGSLWVLDERESKVLHLSAQGKLLDSFGSSGSKDGSFDDPSDLCISSKGLIYVADSGNERIQIFNAGGTLLNILGGKRQAELFDKPITLALDEKDNLFVLDSDKKTVSLFNADGKALLTFGGGGETVQSLVKPIGLAVTPNEILVLDAKSESIKIYNHKGEYQRSLATSGTGGGDLSGATDLFALNDTDLLVSDTGNRRLQTFQLVYTPAPPAKVTGTAGQRTATVKWQRNPESYISGYKVYRSEAADDGFVEIASVSGTVISDTKVRPNTSYYYRVTALAKNGNEGGATTAIEVIPTKIVPPLPDQLKATPQEWSTDLSWTMASPELITEYRVYRQIDGKDVLLGSPKEPVFYDGNLDPQTAYLYEVAAVSIDGVASPRVAVKTTTMATTRPPLEIAIEHLDDIFSNTYKIYETNGVGKVKIVNNTRDRLSKIKVAFTIKDFMDYPAEVEISNLEPHATEELTLKSVFNNLILNLTEDTSVQAEIVATYYKNQDQVKFSKILPIRIFEKHRMTWDERERFSAFVTPKDPVILEFGRAIASQFSEYSDPILFAGVGFDAIGMAGVGYLQDPSNPYQVVSGQTDYVDFIQYPRETLSRKSGDCDDLVALYGSILESLGIRVLVVEVPEHMFMMFATTLDPQAVGVASRSMYVEHEGILWIPVEVTQVGAPFMKAWDVGLTNYLKWKDKGLTLMDIRGAWGTFKPASLPMSDWRAPLITRAELEGRYKDELPTLRKLRLQNLGQSHLALLRSDPRNGQAMLQLGIIYARAGEPQEAVIVLEKACSLLPNNAGARNALGNTYFLLEKYPQAEAAYRKAAELTPDDPEILVNHARVMVRLDMRADAATAFQRAMVMKPEIAEKYRSLAITLGSSF